MVFHSLGCKKFQRELQSSVNARDKKKRKKKQIGEPPEVCELTTWSFQKPLPADK